MKKRILILPLLVFIAWGLGSGFIARKVISIKKPYRPLMASTMPDYQKKDAWISRPDFFNPSLWPLNEHKVQSDLKIDVFYIHPTALWIGNSWNYDLKSPGIVLNIIDKSVSEHASVFNKCCRVYAPHYREAGLGAFRSSETFVSRVKAFEFAYKDLLRAFDIFIKKHNKGRPFILAGHSQGTLHAMRLINDRIDGKELQNKFVAAYVLGYKFPKDYFKRVYKKIRPCQKRNDIGCVIHWDSFDEGSSLKKMHGLHWYPTGWESVTGKDVLCTNPLSWKVDEVIMGRGNHQGMLKGLSEQNYIYEEKKVWAQCRKGRLFVKALDLWNFKVWRFLNWTRELYDGNLHFFDFQLFFKDIRKNASERIEAFYLNEESKDFYETKINIQ